MISLVLQEEDFAKLVAGRPAEVKSTEGARVVIILADIGFGVMRQKVNDAELEALQEAYHTNIVDLEAELEATRAEIANLEAELEALQAETATTEETSPPPPPTVAPARP